MKYPRIQILTIEELLKGAEVKLLPQIHPTKHAQRAAAQAEQPGFDF